MRTRSSAKRPHQDSTTNQDPNPDSPAKRPHQDPTTNQDSNPDSPATSSDETPEQLFSRARKGQTYQELFSLISSNASSQEVEACYMPIFKELAKFICGRDDIPVPPATVYGGHFLFLLKPVYESTSGGSVDIAMADVMMQALVNYINAEDKKNPRQTYESSPEVLVAIKTAWETDYVGNGHLLLKGAMNQMYIKSMDRPYGNTGAIIQGSGTGKSRLVDKLSWLILTIPIILRPESDILGFPLGDFANGEPIVNFFCGFKLKSALHVQRRYLLFLVNIIQSVSEWVDRQKTAGVATECLAAEWHKYIDDPRSEVRTQMYTAATSQDPPKYKGLEDILNEKVQFDTIQKRVRTFINSVSKQIKPEGSKSEPAILFYFDEAHHLTKTTVTAGVPERTAYQCLCKAFTYMMNAPVFAFFLSTYSRLSEFAPNARNFWSSRPASSQFAESDDNLNAPFVELPFDNWKKPVLVTEGSHSIEEICSLKFMARFGRPLFWALLENSESTDEDDAMAFAMNKLQLRFENPLTRVKSCDYPLQELLPPLAARVDLTFESNRDEAVFLEGLLVASSMRTVYSVPQHRQYLRGGYPSEPFLGEAAARVMYEYCRIKALGSAEPTEWTQEKIDKIIAIYKNEIPSAISEWFQRGLIDKGNRGELVARMLCTLAHDIAILKNRSFVGNVIDNSLSFSQMIPVVDFLRALISEEHIEKVLKARPSNLSGKTLEEAFEGAFVHFTQFVKAGDKSTITDEASYTLFTRGGAVQGYPNMADADIGIPVCLPCKDNPDRWCMTIIVFQIKNRSDEQPILIDVQKTLEFFTTPIDEEHSKRPYITIAMHLGVLGHAQKKAPQPKTEPTPSTPKRKPIPLVAESPGDVPSPSKINVLSREREGELRNQKKIHPRYEIIITGCSERVYNVVGDFSYSSLLAHKDMLAEHPRTGAYLDAIKQMKPYWIADSSYDWVEMKQGSRIGARTIKPGDEAQRRLDFSDKSEVDDSEDQSDDVSVNEYRSEDAEEQYRSV